MSVPLKNLESGVSKMPLNHTHGVGDVHRISFIFFISLGLISYTILTGLESLLFNYLQK